ncbi:MAG: hypothetical protein ACK4K0_03595 [Flavobacteriales bacterium]
MNHVILTAGYVTNINKLATTFTLAENKKPLLSTSILITINDSSYQD